MEEALSQHEEEMTHHDDDDASHERTPPHGDPLADEALGEEDSSPQRDHDEDGSGEEAPTSDEQEGEHAASPEPSSSEESDGDDSLFLDPEDEEGEIFSSTTTPEGVEEDDHSRHMREQEERLAEAESRLEEVTTERDDFKQKLLRSAADLENFRKRKEREKEEVRKYGSDRLVLDLLPAVDNLERALEHAEKSEETSSIYEGVRMVHRQLLSSLEKHHVTSFSSVGERFDPQRHEAIQQVETSEHDTGTIIQEFQKGYLLHDRLLRPALAVVAKYVEPQGEEEETETSSDEDAIIDVTPEPDETQKDEGHTHEEDEEGDETSS